jgi:hypothetical protein
MGDDTDTANDFDRMGQLVGRLPSVQIDSDRAHSCAGKPAKEKRRRIVEQQHNRIAC